MRDFLLTDGHIVVIVKIVRDFLHPCGRATLFREIQHLNFKIFQCEIIQLSLLHDLADQKILGFADAHGGIVCPHDSGNNIFFGQLIHDIMKVAGELDDRWFALNDVSRGETLRRRASG